MSEETLAPDQEVYTTDGRVGLYITAYDGRHLVAPIHDHDYETGEPLIGEPVLWDHAFTTPPVARIEANVAALQEQAERLRAEVEELRQEKREAEQSRKATLAKLARHRTLARIEDFIEGRFPPLVVSLTEYGAPKLMTREEAIKDRDRYSRDVKLMVLFGKSDGDLEWRINQYYDGSGSWTTALPVATEDEAKEVVRDLYAAHVKKWREEGRKDWHPAIEWAKGLPSGWVEVPDDVRVAIRDNALAGLRKQEAERAAALSEVQAKIAALEAVPDGPG